MHISAQPPLKDRVYALLMTVPRGKVVTYGQIGAALGSAGLARAIGNILHNNPEPDRIPCYRVVNARGQLAPHFAFGGTDGQRRLLEAEGIRVTDGRVDLSRFGWKF